MIKKLIPAVLLSALLCSCGNAVDYYDGVRVVSPAGAPSVVMYDQGNNADWDTKAPANMPAELQGNYYDVVIFDSITGLSSVKKNNLDFALAKVITGGNFHLIGINTDAEPTVESRIVAFQQGKVPDIVFKHLAGQYWHWDEDTLVEYVGDVSETAAILKTGTYKGSPVNYVLSAEPVITNVKSALNEGITLHEIHDLRADWKAYSGQDAIVQAGVFVRKASISVKNALLSDFMRKLESRLDSLALGPQEAVIAMNEYSSDLKVQAARFGANANVVSALQNDGKNRLGIVSTSETIDVNAFLTKLDMATYSSDYFVTL